ncbi:MAG: tetratricopeptide repeat protein [Inhella sp.]|uniref:tetratricopeptide repeat protein n=1 Tax=Inhella sp. TaxID=1921806 RepID=UPI0022BEDE0E|nr:tetratricopeptide repeat protein [Polaromonas sp.]
MLIQHLLRHAPPRAALDAANEAVLALPEDARLQEALARASVAAGDLDLAVRAYGKLAAMQPGAPEPLLAQARVHGAMKDTPAARRAIQQALRLRPDSVEALAHLAQLEAAERRPAQALAAARRMQALQPKDPRGLALEGKLRLQARQWAAAETALRAALRLEEQAGNQGDIAADLHRALRAQRQDAEAERFASGWQRAHPRDAVFLLHLGEAALARGQLADVEPLLRTVLALQPDNPDVMNNLAWIGQQLGRSDALSLAERACALRPQAPSHLDTLALLQAQHGRHDEALVTQHRAIELAPDNPHLRLTLARIHLLAGDKASARRELERLDGLGDAFAGRPQVQALLRTL